MNILSRIKKVISNAIDFYQLVNLLRNWQNKYKPSQYDSIINQAFNLIDKYGLKPGVLSPTFKLPNNQLEMDFIQKFFTEADNRGYAVVTGENVKERTTFNLKRK